MPEITLWLAGLFLPLFPLSMVFNAVYARGSNGVFRAFLLMLWPQGGVSLLSSTGTAAQTWILTIALFTSVLYAFRAISLREVGQWTAGLATSAWALLWVAWIYEADESVIRLFALAYSVPLALLALLGARMERHFGAAYIGIFGGLAQMLPRFSGVLVFVVFAIIAAPVFPGFFAMLTTVTAAVPTAPSVAFTVTFIWLLWSWAGVRLLQGLIVGPASDCEAPDLNLAGAWIYAAALILLLIGGLYVTGDLL